MYQLHATTTTAAGVAKQPKRSHPDSIATFRALAGQAEVCSALWSRPTIWVPGGVLDQLLARETALARPNMPLLDRFFVPSFP